MNFFTKSLKKSDTAVAISSIAFAITSPPKYPKTAPIKAPTAPPIAVPITGITLPAAAPIAAHFRAFLPMLAAVPIKPFDSCPPNMPPTTAEVLLTSQSPAFL